jgi:hypothetical protein
MNVTYTCRHCEQPARNEVQPERAELVCPNCKQASPFPSEDFQDGKLLNCLVCGCRELFVRKDFSQRLGVAIVVCGLASYLVANAFHLRYVGWGILFATALIDLVLYFRVNSMLQCYRCQAAYRGLSGLDAFEPFDLETYEKFRQQAIRLAQMRR